MMNKYLVKFPEGREYFPEFLPTDDFYSGIYIAPEHMSAYVSDEAETLDLQMTILIEEMSELTKELCKWKRIKGKKGSVCEEMAHVLISMKCVARVLGINDYEVETEIEKKWRCAYEPKKGECKDCYWSIKSQRNNDMPVLLCVARDNIVCDAICSCGGFAKKEENAKLKGELAQAEYELAKYKGVQEVTDIHATNDQDSYVVMWTDREGQKRKIELKLVQNPMDEITRIGTSIYE